MHLKNVNSLTTIIEQVCLTQVAISRCRIFLHNFWWNSGIEVFVLIVFILVFPPEVLHSSPVGNCFKVSQETPVRGEKLDRDGVLGQKKHMRHAGTVHPKKYVRLRHYVKLLRHRQRLQKHSSHPRVGEHHLYGSCHVFFVLDLAVH